MPTVPTYGPPKVATEALPGVRKTAAETSLSTGVGLDDARGETAQTIAGIAGGVARFGVSEVSKMWEQERQRADQVALLEAENKLSNWVQPRLYDPTTGALTVKGKDAMPLPETVGGEFDKVASEIASGLSTDRQREAFVRIRLNHRLNLEGTLREHVFREMQHYETGELTKFVENSTNDAIANAFEPRRIADSLKAVDAAIANSAPRLGLGPEELKAAQGAARTHIHRGVIERLLTLDKDRQAREYYDETKDQIDGTARAAIEQKLETASTAGDGLRASDAIWTRLGPKGEADPINLDAMETAAREQFSDDPKTLKATVQNLRERKAGVDAGRADRKEAVAGALWGAVAKGATLADIRRMPEYLAAPGHLQAQVSEHVVQQAEHVADRSYALSERAYTAGRRAEAEKEQAGWAMLWHYDHPEILSQMTDNQVLALTPELGVDHVNRLMLKKREYGSPAKVQAASIDDDLFKQLAVTAGLDPYKPKLTDPEKATLGQLRNAVETAIDVEQQKKKGLLSREEKSTVMRTIIDRTVMLDNWFRDTRQTAAIVNPSDRVNAYVPIAEIPARSQSEWVNIIRSQIPREQRATREDILSRYQDRIQRAHAAAVLGLGADEELRRLLGR